MIEFVLKNRKLRLHPDGILYLRTHYRGKETKKETWKEVKFSDQHGYLQCVIALDRIEKNIRKHRLIYLAHNPNWDIFDSSDSNFIDHINRDKTDNRIENLRTLTNQQNQFNRDVKGYSFKQNKWEVKIIKNGKYIYIGRFKTEEEAATAYKKAKEEHHVITGNR